MNKNTTAAQPLDLDKLTAKLEVIAQVVDGENLPNTARAVREIAAALARSAITQQAKAPQSGAADTTARASIKTWQERMGPGYTDGGMDLPEEVAMKAEIAELRAALALAAQPVQAGEAVDEHLAVIAKMAETHQCGVTLNALEKVRTTLAPIASTSVSAPASQVAAQQSAAKAPDAHQSVNPAAQAVDARALATKIREQAASLRGPGLRALLIEAANALDASPASTPEASQQAAAVAAPSEMRIGVSVMDNVATIVIMQPIGDGSVATIYAGTHTKGDSHGGFKSYAAPATAVAATTSEDAQPELMRQAVASVAFISSDGEIRINWMRPERVEAGTLLYVPARRATQQEGGNGTR